MLGIRVVLRYLRRFVYADVRVRRALLRVVRGAVGKVGKVDACAAGEFDALRATVPVGRPPLFSNVHNAARVVKVGVSFAYEQGLPMRRLREE